MTSFLIIRGPLGAGKTTTARVVADAISGEVVSIDPILDKWNWDGGSQSFFLKANRVAVKIARPTLEHGTPVVFDGNFIGRTSSKTL